jgi:hypothetical protein
VVDRAIAQARADGEVDQDWKALELICTEYTVSA